MSAPDGVSIREMTFSDIPAGVSLCRASHWNQTERDWEHFLVAAPRGALVAVENGSVIGTVATMPYESFTWLSMLLVNPAARGRGVGTLLLQRGLSLMDEGVATRLDATPAGKPIYRGLGFVAEYRITRLFLPRGSVFTTDRGASRPSVARLLTRADWPAVLDKDLHAFGGSRASLLERLAADAPEYAWSSERDGRLNGHLLGRHGAVREHLGPLIADSDETAWQLLGTCLAAHPDRDFFIDVPDDQQSWRARLDQLGFAIDRPFLRMYRGRLTAAGQPSRVYAITGAEFG